MLAVFLGVRLHQAAANLLEQEWHIITERLVMGPPGPGLFRDGPATPAIDHDARIAFDHDADLNMLFSANGV